MTTPAPNNESSVPNMLIAVMGATGTGKSTLIQTLTGDENVHIGHGQESQTDQVQVSTYFDSDNNCNVTLVDTPGFDDSRDGVSDTDILLKIVDFLRHNGGQTLNGLIYMHRISDPRMGGISKRNLRMFKQLCGDGALKNVCIATTNWDRVTEEEGKNRERELCESSKLFEPLVSKGAQFVRHDKGIISARSILNYLVHKDPTKLQILIELDEGKAFEETEAGSVLKEEVKALIQKQEAKLLALKEEMEEAAREKHAELLAELEEERQKWAAQRTKMEEDLENLKTKAQSDKLKHEATISTLEGKIAADVKQMEAELLAEREAREKLERNNRESLELLKQQAQRDKDKHEADLQILNKTIDAEARAREAAESKARAAERERERQAKRRKEEQDKIALNKKKETELARQRKAELAREKEAEARERELEVGAREKRAEQERKNQSSSGFWSKISYPFTFWT